jgi:fermentation-respiration switch protein FrsA (DUF1100 family)
MGINIQRVVLLIIAIYASYALLCFLAQRLILYPGRTIRASGPSTAGITPIMLETSSGRSEAWLIPARGGAKGRRPLIVFTHGNGEIIDFLPGDMEGFSSIGVAVLLVEYPGYGRSGGSPSEKSISEAVLAAYDAMLKRDDIDPGQIVAFGRSVGSGPACKLARERPLAALILQSPFTSTRPFARRFLLPGFLMRDVYDNLGAVARFNGPLLIMHGRYDDIVPFSHGQELARSAKNARFVELSCSHNDCPPDSREFWRLIGEFLQTNGIVKNGL